MAKFPVGTQVHVKSDDIWMVVIANGDYSGLGGGGIKEGVKCEWHNPETLERMEGVFQESSLTTEIPEIGQIRY